ncbi:MAG: KGK domain-containing protein [Cyanobacteria bacterium P01_A01_bin.17]
MKGLTVRRRSSNKPANDGIELYSDTDDIIDSESVVTFLGPNNGITSKMLLGQDTFRVAAFLQRVRNGLTFRYQRGDKTEYSGEPMNWLQTGIACELLALGGKWQKGRIKIRLVFEPDEPVVEELQDSNEIPVDSDSPLDSIRQSDSA